MKKWLGILLAVALMLGAGLYFYQKSQEIKISSLESIVPEEVIYYFNSYNLADKFKVSQTSVFEQKIVTNPLYLQFIEPVLSRLKQKLPFLPDLFEKDSAAVIYSLATADRYSADILRQSGDFLFLFRIDPKKNIKIKKTMSDFYLSLTAKDQVSRDRYKGVVITNYRLPKNNFSIHYALAGDVTLVSNSIGIMHKCIDLARKQSQNSLLNNQDFQKIKFRAKKDSLFWGYVNNKNYYLQGMPRVKPISDWLDVLENTIFYVDYDQTRSGLVFKTYQTFNKSIESNDNIFKFVYYSQSVDKNTFNLIPRSIVGYYGVTQDMDNLWKFIKKFSSAMAQGMPARSRLSMGANPLASFNIDDMLKKAESFLGVNIENEFLPLLGNNLGVVFMDIEDEGIEIPAVKNQTGIVVSPAQSIPIVIPRIYAFMELKDPSKMQVVIDKMFENAVVNINQKALNQQKKIKELTQKSDQQGEASNAQQPQPSEPKGSVKPNVVNYREVNITTLDIADFPVSSLKINYCILDKYLILSLSNSATKKIIDTFKDKKDSLNTNFDFETAKDKNFNEYSSITFFSLKKLIENIRSTKFFAQMRSSLPQKSIRGFSQGNLDSVLDILSDISSIMATNKKVDDYTVESSCYIKIKGL